LADPRVDPSVHDNVFLLQVCSAGRVAVAQRLLSDPRVRARLRAGAPGGRPATDSLLSAAAAGGGGAVLRVLLEDADFTFDAAQACAAVSAAARAHSKSRVVAVERLLADRRVAAALAGDAEASRGGVARDAVQSLCSHGVRVPLPLLMIALRAGVDLSAVPGVRHAVDAPSVARAAWQRRRAAVLARAALARGLTGSSRSDCTGPR
jgi:hypothetical protein